MVKRVFSLIVFLVFVVLSIEQAWAGSSDIFDLTNIHQGIVRINYPLKNNNKIKVMIQKDGVAYYYDVKTDRDAFPLQMGSGSYQLSLLENIKDNKYEIKSSINVNVKLKDDKISFLQSASPVYWQRDGEVAKIAEKLTKNLDTDEQKAYAIYDYIIKYIKYDKDKITSLSTDYVPMVEEILSSGKGICFDYAALYAAMLRSIDIPTKLVKGYKRDIDTYHAWNEVYLQDQGWVTIDTAYDAVMLEYGTSLTFYKDISEYSKEKEY